MAMSLPLQRVLAGLLACLSCVTGAAAFAAQAVPESGAPPLAYRLEAVSVWLTHQSGNAATPPERITLAGTGSATLARNGQTVVFRFAPKDLVALLNEFYRIRFFDLPTSYHTRYSIFLTDDGAIGTSALRMLDVPSTSICFAVGTYEKCISYGTVRPDELATLAQRIASESERLLAASQAKP